MVLPESAFHVNMQAKQSKIMTVNVHPYDTKNSFV